MNKKIMFALVNKSYRKNINSLKDHKETAKNQ